MLKKIRNKIRKIRKKYKLFIQIKYIKIVFNKIFRYKWVIINLANNHNYN